jgi:hypothetical protein
MPPYRSAAIERLRPPRVHGVRYALHARTFPSAVQGNLTRLSFNQSTKTFVMQFDVDTTIKMPTEILLSDPNCRGVTMRSPCI